MILLTTLASKTQSDIFEVILVMAMALGFLCYKYFIKDENESVDNPPRPTTTKPTKQSLKEMKRIAVKKNGQYTYYRINKYGEIFEEPDGEQ